MSSSAPSAGGSKPYPTYKSPYAPNYKVATNIRGLTFQTVSKFGVRLGAYGGMAGVFAVFFFSDIPRFNRDVMVKFPVVGRLFVKEPLPASDNVRLTLSISSNFFMLLARSHVHGEDVRILRNRFDLEA
ncbi:uncharacterized protein BP5553_08110 [Venustampulla echinocandica]|uniref:Uncharacterized protein n=1 Tax=Venustampulla echinocandica TaxID=2656787 RepID=A0A370TFR1_9HELO|nr:uncharacterized protein BP5553_08110 [Venustampulla echinocandica]RDL33742.1 hypothetical protein BP5553_08110 [Venustampulla echinocandica]